MGKLPIKLLVFLLLDVVAYGATTYFVDCEGGLDGNNGTSTSTPWKRHPAMMGFTGTYAHQVGDAFIFKGGVTWTNGCFPMRLYNWGGGASARDYIGVTNTWFKGGAWSRPIFDSGGTPISPGISNSNLFIGIFVQNGFKIDNIEFTGGFWDTNSSTYPFGGIFVYQSTNISIGNCLFHNWSHSGITAVDEYRIVIAHADCLHYGTEFTNNVIDGTFDGGKSGVALYNWGGLIANNVVSNMSNGMLLGLNPVATNNWIGPINLSYYYDPNASPTNNHENLLELIGGTYGPSATNGFQIMNNHIFGSSAGGTAVVVLSIGGRSAEPGTVSGYICNNIIWDVGRQCIDLDSRYCNITAYVYNNTLYAPPSGAYPNLEVANNTNVTVVVDARNNHLIAGTIHTNYINTYTAQSNLFQTANAAYVSGYTNSNYFAPVAWNQPTPKAGTNLTGQANVIFTTDILGVPRQLTGLWDVGAYTATNFPAQTIISGAGTITGGGTISNQ